MTARKKRNGKKKARKGDSVAFLIASLESIARNEQMAEGKHAPLDSPCSIHIHSKRSRPSDADSVSAKAAIDSLVLAGLLEDDGPAFVTDVSYSQEVSKEEETIISIYRWR